MALASLGLSSEMLLVKQLGGKGLVLKVLKLVRVPESPSLPCTFLKFRANSFAVVDITALYLSVPHCTAPLTALYCTSLQWLYFTFHCTALCSMFTWLHCTVLNSTLLHSTVFYCTPLHCTEMSDVTVVHSTILYCTLLGRGFI